MQDSDNETAKNTKERRIYLGRFGASIDGYAMGTVLAESLAMFHSLGFSIVLDCRGVASIGQNALRGLKAELTSQGDALRFEIKDMQIRIDKAEPNVSRRIARALNQDGLDPKRRFERKFDRYFAVSRLKRFVDFEQKRLDAIRMKEKEKEEELECAESFTISY